jgi:hypothetical protein
VANDKTTFKFIIGGINRFKLWNWLAETRTHGSVENHVWRSMREKLLPSALLEPARDPANPNAVRLDMMAALPSSEIEFAPAESAMLVRGMVQFVEAPGVPGIDGEWFYPLLESLQKGAE